MNDDIRAQLKSKVLREFNLAFFNGTLNVLNMGPSRYAVDFVCSPALSQLDDEKVLEVLNAENSLKSLVKLVEEYQNGGLD